MKPEPKGLIFDIETSLIIMAGYKIHDQKYIPYDNVLQDWFMISAAWQWTDGKKINSVSLLDDPKRFRKDPTDDYHVVKTLRDAIEEADFLIGHNIKGFDYKKLMARIIHHRLKPLPKIPFMDTLIQARKYDFTSRKLGDICKRLGLREKAAHDPKMWMRIIRGEEAAIRECVKYNKADIPPVDDLYNLLKPYMQHHVNHNLWRGEGIDCCPNCGSTALNSRGFRVTRTGKYRSLQCQECGAWCQGKKAAKRVNIR
jgi:hypothetical protein